jgi:hypothetical protein
MEIRIRCRVGDRVYVRALTRGMLGVTDRLRLLAWRGDYTGGRAHIDNRGTG